MRLIDNEAIAEEGKRIRRINSNSEGYTRCTLLPGETEASFEEDVEFIVVDENYGEKVNALIRERYSESQEFAILRQKDEKPQDYQEYYDYCEACKEKAKLMNERA